MTEWILGVGASHNGGACLLRDGELVVAIQEERLTRAKRSRLRPAFDTLAITYCLEEAGIGVADLTVVGVARDEPIDLPESDLARNPLLAAAPSLPPIHYVGHHHAHAAAAAFQSGFADAAVLVIDGMGSPIEDCTPEEQAIAGRSGWETLSMYELRDGTLRPRRKDVARDRAWMTIGDAGMPAFAGFGGMYSAVAYQLFGEYLEAGKVMGLAPYGTPSIPREEFFALSEDGPVFSGAVARRFAHDDRWPERREEYQDLAASVQVAVEDAVLWAAREIRELTGATRLVYAGGVALNCLSNERILRELDFEDVFVMPAAEDSGTSIGAAVAAATAGGHRLGRKRLRVDAPGRSYDRAAADRALAAFPLAAGAAQQASADDVAALLADGAYLGWYTGGAELGPRALGQRSVLADPRGAQTWAALNRLKGREAFRPLAPMVLAEHAEEWFEMGGNPDSPFMLRVCDVREDRRAEVPAIVHVDGSARVQTLTVAQNPRLHAVIEAFHVRTGVPIVVNTSFNAAGEPIVETPEDALWCAHRLGLSALVLEGRIVPLGAGAPDDDVVLEAAPFRIRRSAGHLVTTVSEVDVETPWGTTRHWLGAAELAVLDRLAGDEPLTLRAAEDEAGRRVVEGLRRKRLLRAVRVGDRDGARFARAKGLAVPEAGRAR